MNLSGKMAMSLAIALFVATSAHAGGDRYQIDATLLHDGRPFAAPAMAVLAGEPATVEAGGPDAFRLAIKATGIDAETVRIEADLESVHGSMQPTIIVRTGEPASVAVRDLRVELKVARLRAARSP